MTPTGPTKAELRIRYREIRACLSPEQRFEADAGIRTRLDRLIRAAGAKVVLAYWPIDRHAEVDLRPLVLNLAERGVVVGLPCITGHPPGIMQIHEFTDEHKLTPNKWGGLESCSERIVAPSEIGFAVVPALAADRLGFRLGYGMGYFDRFLPELRCQAAVVVYSDCLLDAIPADPHDVPVDFVITEVETIATRRPAT